MARDYIPDSSDICAYQERLREQRLQRRKRCDDCYEPIQEEHYFETDEGDLCESCFDDFIARFTKHAKKRIEDNELL